MLITQLKAKEAITSLTAGKKVFIINCHGCKEVRFPEKEAARLQKELAAEGNVTGIMTTDYICNPENMELRLKKHMSKIQEADLVLVFSCGVGEYQNQICFLFQNIWKIRWSVQPAIHTRYQVSRA